MNSSRCLMCEAHSRGLEYPLDELAILEHHDEDLDHACQKALKRASKPAAVAALRSKVLSQLNRWNGHTSDKPVTTWLEAVSADVLALADFSTPWSIYTSGHDEWQSRELRAWLTTFFRAKLHTFPAADREDAVQMVYQRLFKRLEVPRGMAEPPQRLISEIAKSVASNEIKKRERRKTHLSDDPHVLVDHPQTDAETDRVDSRLDLERVAALHLVDFGMTLRDLDGVSRDHAAWTRFCTVLAQAAARQGGLRGALRKQVEMTAKYSIVLVAEGNEVRAKAMLAEFKRVLTETCGDGKRTE